VFSLKISALQLMFRQQTEGTKM